MTKLCLMLACVLLLLTSPLRAQDNITAPVGLNFFEYDYDQAPQDVALPPPVVAPLSPQPVGDSLVVAPISTQAPISSQAPYDAEDLLDTLFAPIDEVGASPAPAPLAPISAPAPSLQGATVTEKAPQRVLTVIDEVSPAPQARVNEVVSPPPPARVNEAVNLTPHEIKPTTTLSAKPGEALVKLLNSGQVQAGDPQGLTRSPEYQFWALAQKNWHSRNSTPFRSAASLSSSRPLYPIDRVRFPANSSFV
ncbi:MAG: hypothetical protein ACRCTY_07970, partial [Candidatus Adiutrix sp.]